MADRVDRTAVALTDKDAVEAADLQRRRVRSAFSTGTASDAAALARRPHRALYGGLALTVVVALGIAIGSLLSDSVPKDWAAEGTVVVRETTGVRHLSTQGRLRPVRNDSSLALAGLPTPRVVPVDETRFVTRPVGEPIGIVGAPSQRPGVPDDDVPWWACQRPGAPLALLTAGGPATGGRALLGVAGGRLVLVADGVAHPVTPVVARVLGYDPRAARPLPRAFFALLPQGRPLTRLALRREAAPAVGPTKGSGPAPSPGTAGGPVPSPGTAGAPALPSRTLIQDTGDDSLHVVDAGQLRPVTGTTALRLLYGGKPPAPRRIPAQQRRALPEGPPLQVPGFPASPPPVAAPDSYVCITSAGGVLSEQSLLPVLGLQPGPVARTPDLATVWQPTGVGAVVRVGSSLQAAVSDRDPVLLVTEGRGFRISDEVTLRALSYTGEQVQPRPAAWFGLLPRGPALTSLSLR